MNFKYLFNFLLLFHVFFLPLNSKIKTMNMISDIEMIKMVLSKFAAHEKEVSKMQTDLNEKIKSGQSLKAAADAFKTSPFYESALKEIQTNEDFDYPISGTWREKIVAMLNHRNRVMTPASMFNLAKRYEGTKYSQSQLRGAISNELNKLVKNEVLKTWKPTKAKVKGFYYAQPTWFEASLLDATTFNLNDEFKPESKKDW